MRRDACAHAPLAAGPPTRRPHHWWGSLVLPAIALLVSLGTLLCLPRLDGTPSPGAVITDMRWTFPPPPGLEGSRPLGYDAQGYWHCAMEPRCPEGSRPVEHYAPGSWLCEKQVSP